jgi:hypothetical protein
MTTGELGWAEIDALVAGAAVQAELLPAEAVPPIGVLPDPWLARMASAAGGILVDHGWLRMLGAGHPRIGDGLVGWNARLGGQPLDPPLSDGLIVAYDAVGGFFSIFPDQAEPARSGVVYRSSEDEDWQALGLDYSTFLRWTLSGRLAQFSAASRWPGWEREVGEIPADQALMIYPPLGFEGPAIELRNRATVSARELWTHIHSLSNLQPGEPTRIVVASSDTR